MLPILNASSLLHLIHQSRENHIENRNCPVNLNLHFLWKLDEAPELLSGRQLLLKLPHENSKPEYPFAVSGFANSENANLDLKRDE